MPAEKRFETTTPAKTTVMREAPVLWARLRISSAPRRAPKKAASGANCWAVGPMAQTRAAANPALELTPMMLGDARGL